MTASRTIKLARYVGAAVAFFSITGSAAASGGFNLPSGPYVLQSGQDWFGDTSFQYLDASNNYGFTAFDYHSPKPDPSFGLGSTDGTLPTGFSVSTYANATAGFQGSASVTNTLNWLWGQHVDTLIAGADQFGTATVGSTFTIGSNSGFNTHTLSTGAGVFQTSNIAYENIGVGAHLEGCLVGFCDGTDIGIGDGQNGHSINLFSYDSATNTVTAFNQVTQNALPQTYHDDNNLFAATVYKPDLTGAAQGTDPHFAALSSSAKLGGVSFDVAGAAALALGIPEAALKDSIAGFNYETVGAYVGAGIDLDQTVAMQPFLVDHIYHFTSDVQVLDAATGTWGAPTDTVDLAPDQFAEVRAPNALNLGVTVENKASFKTNTTLQLNTYLEAQLVLLHIDGHGLDQSLLDQTYQLAPPASLFDVSDTMYTSSQSIFEPAINLAFSVPFDIGCPECSSSGLVTLSFIPGPPGAAPDPDAPTDNIIFKALNFGTTNCNNGTLFGCVLDTSVRPYANVTRGVLRDGKRVMEVSANGFTLADTLLGLPDTGPIDPVAEQAALKSLLMTTYPGGVRPNIDLAPGVPEPATWMELLLGAGLAGGALRFRRTRAA